MSFWSALWGAPGTIGKAVDMVRDTGDALVFTEEEKAAANQKTLDFVIRFHEASRGSDLARRLIAILVVGVFLVLVLLTASLYVVGALTADIQTIGEVQTVALNVFDLAGDRVYKLLSDVLAEPVTWILGFYFAARMLRDYTTKEKG